MLPQVNPNFKQSPDSFANVNGEVARVAVVIPCYKVRKHILELLIAIGDEVDQIYCIDDCCPEDSGKYIQQNSVDSRVRVIFHDTNQGVGGAAITGFKQAVKDNHDVVVKLDGDGQMDPAILKKIVKPILTGRADYTKGNRFYNLDNLLNMPKTRIVGNAVLSFINKFSSGYWHIFDPSNGYVAIHAKVIDQLSLDKIEKRYFFESDMLFHLNIINAVVVDVPMTAKYSDEVSNLKISHIIFPFLFKHMKNFTRRIFYNYFLRDFSIVSMELIVGLFMLIGGVVWGGIKWYESIVTGVVNSVGTVLLSALPIILGIQFLLAFLNHDMAEKNRTPIHLID
ncbi:MAG: glycosyltransferase family 2 protein [Magnetococcales bacterium]|nr:glycosyltransferase family 2 protein [Magnetococcales bacterium]